MFFFCFVPLVFLNWLAHCAPCANHPWVVNPFVRCHLSGFVLHGSLLLEVTKAPPCAIWWAVMRPSKQMNTWVGSQWRSRMTVAWMSTRSWEAVLADCWPVLRCCSPCGRLVRQRSGHHKQVPRCPKWNLPPWSCTGPSPGMSAGSWHVLCYHIVFAAAWEIAQLHGNERAHQQFVCHQRKVFWLMEISRAPCGARRGTLHPSRLPLSTAKFLGWRSRHQFRALGTNLMTWWVFLWAAAGPVIRNSAFGTPCANADALVQHQQVLQTAVKGT